MLSDDIAFNHCSIKIYFIQMLINHNLYLLCEIYLKMGEFARADTHLFNLSHIKLYSPIYDQKS